MKENWYLRCLFMFRSSCFETINITNWKIQPWTFCTSDSNLFSSTHSGFNLITVIKLWNIFQRGQMWYTMHDTRSYIPLTLIALFLLNKFRIFFHGNLEGSLSRLALLLTRVDFDLNIRFINFSWLLLPCDTSSNCVLFCLGSRLFSLDIMNCSILLLMVPIVLSVLTFYS